MILLGAFKKSFIVAIFASIGVILSAAYMLWLYRRVVFGKIVNADLKNIVDLNKSEKIILWTLAIPSIFYGFYPEPIFNTIDVSINNLIQTYNANLDIYFAGKN